MTAKHWSNLFNASSSKEGNRYPSGGPVGWEYATGMGGGPMTDWEIRLEAKVGMIEPFVDRQQRGHEQNRVISFGLSSFGYDARLASTFKAYHPWGGVIDPKQEVKDWWMDVDASGGPFDLPSHQYVLACTVEKFKLPRDVVALCIGKSTYARCGLVVNTTPLEPGWEGQLTLELYNAAPMPIRLWPDEGVCQIVFFRGRRPEVTYDEREGKYQGQEGVVGPRL
jgi:dCTP deaminase